MADFVENQLIVKFKTELNKSTKECIKNNQFYINKLDQLNLRNHLKKISLTGNKNEKRTFLLTINNITNIQQKINEYKNTNLFEYVEPNYIGSAHGKKIEIFETTPNDNLFFRQWSLVNDGTFTQQTSTFDADIDMDLAWDIETGSSDIIVAVLDSGTRINHPEFNGRIWVNPNDTNDGTDNDANGYTDDINGWNFESNTNNLVDATGHGSNVAGIIGLNANNNIGYAGIDWNCKLMICRVLDDDGFGQYSWWTEAIYYAVDNGANVLNMSVGGNSFSQTLKDAVDYAHANNVSVVVSSGNQNVNGVQYPSRYENAISVGSTDANDQRSSPFFWDTDSGSNYGTNLDIIAPGGLIFGINHTSNTQYNYYWGGTSQAAPHVTGVISLLLAQNPALTPNEIKNILQTTADDEVGLSAEDTPGFDIYHGYGRLNANQALLQGTASITDLENRFFTIYPNPITNNTLQICNLKPSIYYLKITNVIGETVYSKKIDNNDTTINIENLISGVYFVTINNNTLNFTQKIIKK